MLHMSPQLSILCISSENHTTLGIPINSVMTFNCLSQNFQSTLIMNSVGQQEFSMSIVYNKHHCRSF